MKYVLMGYSRTVYAEYPLPQFEAGQWELLRKQTRFDLPEELWLAISYQNGHPQFLSGPFSIRSHSGRRGYPLPVEASEIYFLSFPFGGQLVMVAKGIEEELSPAFCTHRLDRAARNYARCPALETIRQILKLRACYTIQHKKVI